MNYVIIGNSAAAVGAVTGIRAVDKAGTITVISDEPYHNLIWLLNKSLLIISLHHL